MAEDTIDINTLDRMYTEFANDTAKKFGTLAANYDQLAINSALAYVATDKPENKASSKLSQSRAKRMRALISAITCGIAESTQAAEASAAPTPIVSVVGGPTRPLRPPAPNA